MAGLVLALSGAFGPAAANAAGNVSARSSAGWTQIAQADTTTDPNGSQIDEDDEEDVPIPPNLLEPETNPPVPDTTAAPGSMPDTTGVLGAPRDSTGTVVPTVPAEPETLFSVPPGTKPGTAIRPGANTVVPAPIKKSRGGIFGLTPALVILSLAVVHILVLRAVGD